MAPQRLPRLWTVVNIDLLRRMGAIPLRAKRQSTPMFKYLINGIIALSTVDFGSYSGLMERILTGTASVTN
jgi:hypothetical protein